MKKDKEDKIEIVTIDGVEYLTFPQTEIFTGVEKGVLQQQVNRKVLTLKKIGKYGFVSYDKCLELREKNETNLKMKVLQELGTSDMSIDEIKQLVEVTKYNRNIQ